LDQGYRDVEGDDGVTCVTSRDDGSRDHGHDRDGDDGVAKGSRLYQVNDFQIQSIHPKDKLLC